MARFNGDEIENYASQGNGGGFFSLKKDKETAKVRFMYSSAEDIEGFSVHKVQVGDKERYVNCIREYNEPVENCPFCAAKIKTQAKLFIPLYNEDKGQLQFWERGKKFYGKISGMCARMPNIVGTVIEIERNGAPGDTDTTYELYPGKDDGTTVQDILDDLGMEALESPLGNIILDKTAEEMEEWLDTGHFPDADVPQRRRPSRDSRDAGADRNEEAPRRGSRRTPARGGDRF